MGFVLGEHHYLGVGGIHHVGKGEVNQPKMSSERDRWLGAVSSKRHKAFSFAAGKDES